MKYRFNEQFNPITSDIPWRYHKRIFTLVHVVGDYGIFTVPSRKLPFVIPMNKVESV